MMNRITSRTKRSFFSKRVRHYIKQNNMKEEEIKELFEQFEAIANE